MLAVLSLSALVSACGSGGGAHKGGDRESWMAQKERLAQTYPTERRLVCDYDGLSPIDMHLHPGTWDKMAMPAREFIASLFPGDDLLHSWLVNSLQDPYEPPLGIAQQCQRDGDGFMGAGMEYCGVFAVYAWPTWGEFSNDEMVALLNDPRNGDDTTYFGLASLDYNDTTHASLYRALEDPQIKGIKLAAPHNLLPINDPRHEEIYAIADRYDQPVVLHMSSPHLLDFDLLNATDQAIFCAGFDADLLEPMVRQYPNVTFLLSHIGYEFKYWQHERDRDPYCHIPGQRSKMDAVFELAVKYTNVHLEMADLGLVSRTHMGSGGPQYPGYVKSHLDATLSAMCELGFTRAEVEAIATQNTKALFRLP
eukprot:TRINITY_DN1504_c0_g1_i5.p1 TRINITY_DN1504_c0_g1~~TRINITY_DN1504_c0_g1_i5.p1  ORF type:complete len:366 (-),score=83.05 TRINITY_DN1504_c0_g1_i5:26-1123(-)